MCRRRPRSPLFPYTTLFRSPTTNASYSARPTRWPTPPRRARAYWRRDRKSTRLNSSHPSISYAVFCLKKNIHIQLAGNRVILVVIFDSKSSLGLVRLRVRKASEELNHIFEAFF